MNEQIKVHVVKYADKRHWQMRYVDSDTGRQVRRSTGTTNRKDAVKEAGKWKAQLREGRYHRLHKLAWQEFRGEYEQQILPANSTATGVAKVSAMNHLERVINPKRVSDLTTAKLETFQNKLRAEGMRETTIAAHLAHLKPIIRWAVKRKLLREMPDITMAAVAIDYQQRRKNRVNIHTAPPHSASHAGQCTVALTLGDILRGTILGRFGRRLAGELVENPLGW